MIDYEQTVATGIVALFGGALVWAAIGALVGRFQGFQVGAATGMMLFGCTGLAAAGWLAWGLWGPLADGAPSRDQIGVVGVFGAFGAFGLLGGGVVLSDELERRHPRPRKAVSARRAGLASAFNVSGTLAMLGGFGLGIAMDDDAVRGTLVTFRGVAVACACWFVAGVLRQGFRMSALLFFLVLGGGFWLAAVSLKWFGG